MSKQQDPQKTEKTQTESNELAEDQLETVSGGIIAVLQQGQVTDKWIPETGVVEKVWNKL